MALNRLIHAFTRPAAANYATNQYCLMVLDSDGKALLATTTTASFIGVLMNKPSAEDQAAEIAGVGSIVKVLSGDTIAEGDKITAEAGGKALATTTSPNHYAGIAISPASDGEYFEMIVSPGMVSS